DNVISFQDVMPTLAELTGAKIPKNIDGISMVNAFLGRTQERQHKYLYWDYGHCRNRYDQAVRMGKWKGIRLGKRENIQLYDLETDIGEEKDLAKEHPEIVMEIEKLMKEAYVPNKRYPIGIKYTGSPIWKKDEQK
ncbi:MAG: hypothetical protein R2757_22030, partial [Draconibacterium sp.]